jgi:hypothetical protein
VAETAAKGDQPSTAALLKSGVLHPKNPERVCWGCDKYCPADDLACGNGTIRTPHPCELFGEEWYSWVGAIGPS